MEIDAIVYTYHDLFIKHICLQKGEKFFFGKQ